MELGEPYLLKDIRQLEQLQRCATEYILNDYTSNYKSQLLELKILPLMYVLDICDIMFFIKSLKAPTNAFNVTDYILNSLQETHDQDLAINCNT